MDGKTDKKSGYKLPGFAFDWIENNIPCGSTILELGSGDGTKRLAMHYNMYSIEHDPFWVNRHDSTYIYAPIKKDWYDVRFLKNKLPKYYDLLLVDGPPGKIGRLGFIENIGLFDTNTCMLFDDVKRKEERRLVNLVSDIVGRNYEEFKNKKRIFCVFNAI